MTTIPIKLEPTVEIPAPPPKEFLTYRNKYAQYGQDGLTDGHTLNYCCVEHIIQAPEEKFDSILCYSMEDYNTTTKLFKAIYDMRVDKRDVQTMLNLVAGHLIFFTVDSRIRGAISPVFIVSSIIVLKPITTIEVARLPDGGFPEGFVTHMQFNIKQELRRGRKGK